MFGSDQHLTECVCLLKKLNDAHLTQSPSVGSQDSTWLVPQTALWPLSSTNLIVSEKLQACSWLRVPVTGPST